MTAEKMAGELRASGEVVSPKEWAFSEAGDLAVVLVDGSFRMFTPCELAKLINMPLWEVVMVDNGGFDNYAILFYED